MTNSLYLVTVSDELGNVLERHVWDDRECVVIAKAEALLASAPPFARVTVEEPTNTPIAGLHFVLTHVAKLPWID